MMAGIKSRLHRLHFMKNTTLEEYNIWQEVEKAEAQKIVLK